jgi:hypothetical protein
MNGTIGPCQAPEQKEKRAKGLGQKLKDSGLGYKHLDDKT